jgi:hypothetical protein
MEIEQQRMSAGMAVFHVFLVKGRCCQRGNAREEDHEGFHRSEFYQAGEPGFF